MCESQINDAFIIIYNYIFTYKLAPKYVSLNRRLLSRQAFRQIMLAFWEVLLTGFIVQLKRFGSG